LEHRYCTLQWTNNTITCSFKTLDSSREILSPIGVVYLNSTFCSSNPAGLYWWTDHSLVGVDPGTEEADSGVDGGAGWRAPAGPPRGSPHEGRTAHQGAPAVTVARADCLCCGLDADVTVVDLGGRPGVGTGGVGHDRYDALLKGGGQGAGSTGSAPA